MRLLQGRRLATKFQTLPFSTGCGGLGRSNEPARDGPAELRHKVRWVLKKSGQFSTRSRWFTHRGVIHKRLRTIWGSKLPRKLKVFLWLVTHDKLQPGAELKGRKWKGSPLCNICGKQETVDHIFFTCSRSNTRVLTSQQILKFHIDRSLWRSYIQVRGASAPPKLLKSMIRYKFLSYK